MKKKIYSLAEIPIKHKHVFIFYSELLSYLGKDAAYFSKSKIYQDVAAQFYLDRVYAAYIIKRLLKLKYSPSIQDYQDYALSIKGLTTIMKDHL